MIEDNKTRHRLQKSNENNTKEQEMFLIEGWAKVPIQMLSSLFSFYKKRLIVVGHCKKDFAKYKLGGSL